ncbi:hypothetical protein [Sorangium sp. So ce1182]|uniref:hypothetical protein n=1 Tax=Sorangium sp. So ce1182 TaxID=3133334 RepID=UPI003F61D8D7
MLHPLHGELREVLDLRYGMAEPRALTELMGHGLGDGDALIQARKQVDPVELMKVQER